MAHLGESASSSRDGRPTTHGREPSSPDSVQRSIHILLPSRWPDVAGRGRLGQPSPRAALACCTSPRAARSAQSTVRVDSIHRGGRLERRDFWGWRPLVPRCWPDVLRARPAGDGPLLQGADATLHPNRARRPQRRSPATWTHEAGLDNKGLARIEHVPASNGGGPGEGLGAGAEVELVVVHAQPSARVPPTGPYDSGWSMLAWCAASITARSGGHERRSRHGDSVRAGGGARAERWSP